MNLQELSNQFDVLVSSYRRFRDFDNKEPMDTIEFNEYEKSLFLTKAQEELVLSLYNGRNSSLQSFEETEELRRYLSNLVEEAKLEPIVTSDGKPLGIESNSKFFTLPEDLWFLTYESALLGQGKCEGHTSQDVYPVTQDEYNKVKKNPFRGANFRRALRLDLSENNIEVISKYEVTGYYVRYIKKLQPIVLVDMPNGITVGGVGIATECQLHDSLHQRILEMAVEMAMRNKLSSTSKQEDNN